ncbi:uncharacterized protein DFL_009043 [Arthrobotrys flagrans]|uniref:Fungal N-terminal domain-containing protein n=1 Tax=Arthrobotrys flagrans TaxID=97331 RepID=A0A436ZQG9_ARTFL|nr:hypothetical protein DFL_009043 [Arthrobotrys flagrans]
MAEAVGIASAAITFISAAVVVIRTTQQVTSDFRTCAKDLSDLVDEITHLDKILQKLQDLETAISKFPNQVISEAGLTAPFRNRCTRDLRGLEECVTALRRNLNGNVFQRLKAKLYWGVGTKLKAKQFTSKIQEYKGSLTVALDVFQSFVSLHNTEQLDGIQNSITENKKSHDKKLHNITQNLDRLNQSSSQSKRLLSDFQIAIETIDKRLKEGPIEKRKKMVLTLPCHQIPYPPNGHFLGRESLLEDIKNTLQAEKVPGSQLALKAFALYGMPGVGKTQTALRYVYSNTDYYKIILWISADETNKILQDFSSAATLLGLDVNSNDLMENFRAVNNFLIAFDKPWLIVYDNADDLDILQTYLPTTNKGNVLVTSRNPEARHGAIESGAEKFKAVDPLKLATLSYQLGHLPLALDQIASYLRESECPLDEFIRIYADREQALQLQETKTAKVPWYAHTIATSFDLSIKKLSIEASTTLEVFGFLHPDAIPDIMLDDKEAGSFLNKSLSRYNIIRDLRRFSLITYNEKSRSISLHRLVQDAALRQTISKPLPNEAFGIVVRLLYQAFPKQHPFRNHMTELWEECEKYVPHVITFHERFANAVKTVEPHLQVSFCELLYNCCWYLFERGRFDTSLEIARTAELICEKADIKDGGLLLADIYTVQGAMHTELSDNVDVATELFQKALEVREAAVTAGALEIDHPNRANSFMNLGVSVANSDPAKALELQKRAIDIRESTTRFQKEQESSLSLNYLNIGRCYWMVGDPDQAVISFQTCIAIVEELETRTKGSYIQKPMALSALGNVQIDQKKMGEALTSWTKAMQSMEEILGTSHLKTASCYYKVGWLVHKQKEYNRAIDLINLALDTYNKKTPTTVRGEIARAKRMLARVQEDAGLVEAAKQNKREAEELKFSITGKVIGEEETEQDYDNLVAYFYR